MDCLAGIADKSQEEVSGWKSPRHWRPAITAKFHSHRTMQNIIAEENDSDSVSGEGNNRARIPGPTYRSQLILETSEARLSRDNPTHTCPSQTPMRSPRYRPTVR